MSFVYIGLFGLIGVFSRYFVGLLASTYLMPTFPFGIFLINLLGSLLIGVVYVIGVERAAISPDLRLGLIVGFLGGFTTFSSFTLEAVRLVEEAEYFYAALYLILSPALGFLAALGGILLAKKAMGGFP